MRFCDSDTGRSCICHGCQRAQVCSRTAAPERACEDLYEQVQQAWRRVTRSITALLQEHAQQLLCDRQRGSAALILSRNADAPSLEAIAQYLEQLRSPNARRMEMMHLGRTRCLCGGRKTPLSFAHSPARLLA